jgi:broad specificity phosphatase PhoE
MTKTLVLLRHTDNDGDVLSDEGVAAAVDLGSRLKGDYALAVSTGAQRATQTVACILAAGARATGGVVVEAGLRSDAEDRWRDAYQEAGGGELGDFRRVAPDFVEAEARALGAALRRVADRLEDGQRALIVGHSPTNEAAVLGLTGEEIASMSKGERVDIEIDGETTKVHTT